ncbi:uncharacterized protein LOC125178456 [Hyalella azteca]|uniref:Uncharacterized protein LOC125178456 n=1 Tax=Hyalella azteca TaxID=294128 RepID=A0A979FPP6_HYAAZ|nr:uncharacterized protein LOC125178456 [Hyalella azteca]
METNNQNLDNELDTTSSPPGGTCVCPHWFQEQRMPHYQEPTAYQEPYLDGSIPQNTGLTSIKPNCMDFVQTKTEVRSAFRSPLRKSMCYPQMATEDANQLYSLEYESRDRQRAITSGFRSSRSPVQQEHIGSSAMGVPVASLMMGEPILSAHGLRASNSTYYSLGDNVFPSSSSNASGNNDSVIFATERLGAANSEARGSNCFEISFEIPIYFVQRVMHEISLGFIDLTFDVAAEFESIPKIFITEVDSLYSKRHQNSFPKQYFFEGPRKQLDNLLLSSVETKRNAVPASRHAACEACRRRISGGFAKISGDLDQVPFTIHHPPISEEHDILILFFVSNRCFPFCVEDYASYPKVEIWIKGDSYDIQVGSGSSPVQLNHDVNFLAIVVYIHGEVHVINQPNFQLRDHVVVIANGQKFFIHFEDEDLQTRWPVTDYLDRDEHKLYFKCKQKHFPLKTARNDEMYLSPNPLQPSLLSKTWNDADTVNAVYRRTSHGSSIEHDHYSTLTLGSRGQLVNTLNSGWKKYRRVFRPFLTDDDRLIVLEKSLKCSLNFNYLDRSPPVSYTHLDVYKRQLLRCIMKQPFK